jgi:hypothetical protein
MQGEHDAVEPVIEALKSDGTEEVSFVLEKAAGHCPAALAVAQPGRAARRDRLPGRAHLVEGAIPAP